MSQEIVWTRFAGIEPITDEASQVAEVATIAHDVKLWHGRLDPWREPKKVADLGDACSAHLKDCCWRGDSDPCAQFVDIDPCGGTVKSSPTTKPILINDWCGSDAGCPLGFPCPKAPKVDMTTSSESHTHSQVRAYVVAYGDGCNHGSPSQASEVFYCTDKDDCFTITVPQPDAEYCNVTEVCIFRLVATFDVSKGFHAHGSDDWRSQPYIDTTPEASWFLVARLPLGVTTYEDCGGVLEADMCDSLISEDWEEPPCGLIISGMTDTGALVGFIGDRVRFSEFNTHMAWPCKYEMTMNADVVKICVVGAYIFVFTTCGIHIITDTIQALEDFCRPMHTINRELPTCNPKGILCAGDFVIFVSQDGLYRVTVGGDIQNISTMFAEDNWRSMDPATMRLGLYSGRVMMTSDTFSGILDVNIYGDEKTVSNTLSTISICPTCWINDKQGQLHLLAGGSVYAWDRGDENLEIRWQSGHRNYPGFNKLTAGMIEHTNATQRVEASKDTYFAAHADESMYYSRTIGHNRPFRMCSTRGRKFSVEVRSHKSITAIHLAPTITCIGA